MMPIFLKVFPFLGIVLDLLSIVRFRRNKYFIYFCVLALIDPIHFVLIHFFKINSYAVLPFIGPVLLLALPKREIKQIIFSLLSLIILFPHFGENKIIPLLITTLNIAYIIYILCEDLFNEIKIKSYIPVFLPVLILEIFRGLLTFYLYYENPQLLANLTPMPNVLSTIFMMLIIYFGSERKVKYSFNKKEDGIESNNNHIKTEMGLRRELAPELLANLTKREIEIVLLIGTGLKSKDIAEKLYLSCKTVSNHRLAIKEKLGFSDYESIKNFLKTTKMEQNSI